MRYSTQVKPISYLKANAAEVLLQLAEQREPLALLKILALGNQEIEAGKITLVNDVVARLRARQAGR